MGVESGLGAWPWTICGFNSAARTVKKGSENCQSPISAWRAGSENINYGVLRGLRMAEHHIQKTREAVRINGRREKGLGYRVREE